MQMAIGRLTLSHEWMPPAIRENNRCVLRHMVDNSKDYDDTGFLLAFSSMVLLKDAVWQRGKLDRMRGH